jgi:hypothetical protein
LVKSFADYAVIRVFSASVLIVAGWAASARVPANVMARTVHERLPRSHPATVAAYERRTVLTPRLYPSLAAASTRNLRHFREALALHAHSALAVSLVWPHEAAIGSLSVLRVAPSLVAFTRTDAIHLERVGREITDGEFCPRRPLEVLRFALPDHLERR